MAGVVALMLPHIVLLHILYVSFNFDNTGALHDGSRYISPLGCPTPLCCLNALQSPGRELLQTFPPHAALCLSVVHMLPLNVLLYI